MYSWLIANKSESKIKTKEASPCICVCPVSSIWFQIAPRFAHAETAYFSFGKINDSFK